MKRFSKIVSRMRDVPLGPGHEGHELRLQVGREARERVGRHVHGLDAVAVATDADAAMGRGDLGARLAEHVEGGLEEIRPGVLEHDVAAGHGDRHGVGAGLDAVGQHVVGRAVEPGDALDHDLGGAGSLDPARPS